jgi:DNA-binding beta-propeller fold protein YncE
MRSKSNEEQPRLQCASCEKPSTVVAFCLQCNGVICDDCVKAHKMMKQVCEDHVLTMLDEFKRENVENYLKNQGLCKEKYHEVEKLKFYCEECRVSICQKCAILAHKDHVKSSIEEVAERAEQLLENDLKRVSQLTEKYEEDLVFSKENMKRIITNIENAKEEVHRKVELIINSIRDHEAAMIECLDEIQMKQEVANQKEQSEIDAGLKRLSEFQVYSRKMLDRKLACEILESQEALIQRCQTLLEQPSVLPQQPIKRNVTVEYVTHQEVMQSLQEIGKIVECVTDPSNYAILIESLEETRCGFVNEFEIVTKNSDVCHATHSEMISVTIKDCDAKDVERVCRYRYGKLLVSFEAKKADTYQISATIGGQPISQSPQNINTFSATRDFQPIKVFGKQGKSKGGLNTPWSLALSENGEIAVVDCDNNCVILFDPDGKFVRQFGNKGKNDGYLSHPCGVTFCEGKVVVSDQPDDNGRIQEFDVNGKYLRLLYKSQGFLPRGMCITYDNNIAVCCDGNEQQKPGIKLLSQEGEIIHEFSSGNQHNCPVFVAYGNGKYFVTYYLKSRISVFDKNGDFLYKFGDKNSLSYVCGLSVCGQDMVVVCNCVNHCIQLFTQEGKYLSSFGSMGTGIGQMINPNDVVVNAKGQVFVLECGGHRVQVWH